MRFTFMFFFVMTIAFVPLDHPYAYQNEDDHYYDSHEAGRFPATYGSNDPHKEKNEKVPHEDCSLLDEEVEVY
jgi:hypothetical protein